jgi:hypothetical protein
MSVGCPSGGDTLNDLFQYRIPSRVITGMGLLFLAFCLVLSFPHRNAAAKERGQPQQATASSEPPVSSNLRSDPIYRISLRVHLGESGRSPADFKVILEEINDIWLSQAGICFEIQIVLNNEPLKQGMDIWFLPVLPGGPDLNGYFRDEHHIQVRDTPALGPAPHPAHYPAARTAAHEFGHGLSLPHRQDSDDNLMRSKTYGWQLNGREIQEARRAAAEKTLKDTKPRNCDHPGFFPLPTASSMN